MSFNERTVALIGEKNAQKLKQKNIIIFGVGGVGGYVVEMLSRTGIGKLTLVDFDVVSESNINRQIIATKNTIGKTKVECFKKRINNINHNCQVKTICQKVEKDNLEQFDLKHYDFVIDCIDTVFSKVALIEYCCKNNIKIISSMGAGNRFELPKFEICDISKTHDDALARVIRAKLRKVGINHTMVCYSSQPSKKQKVVGSIAYFPASAGINISAYIINELLKGD